MGNGFEGIVPREDMVEVNVFVEEDICPHGLGEAGAISSDNERKVSHAKIFLNRTVIREFSWLTTTIESSDGVHMLDAIKWDESLTDLTIYCDASLNSIGFVAPALKTCFCGTVPTDCPIQTIFFFESLSVASAILWASGLDPPIRRLLVFTNSLNCVEMFNFIEITNGIQ